ncbi:MAG: hypothetical protein CVU57_22035 [Deltaproteobacteria bacterium HGW-Deltaproteobacteria-15]|jgi:hypothetical protein|nr:MAG: hypothetical protein CVU57_22035 [Deltaproteobacteria bacterium HGW-Deltaproteobacteria-15]
MITDNFGLQSAGSFSIAVLALIMAILQAIFYLRKPQFVWFGWSAAISFSGMIYAIGIVLEYNAPPGSMNRFGGLLEYTAVIGLIHCLYGFSFSYLGLNGKRYHAIAGVFHFLVLVLLWAGEYIVANRFVARDFIGLPRPFMEAELGPLGPLFVLYAILASAGAIMLWIVYKGPHLQYKGAYLTGMVFWIGLGIHDAMASLGAPAFHYVMEYGFLGFSMVVLWVAFSSFVDISAEDKYRVITEFANDGILVVQDGKMAYGNRASSVLFGRPVTDEVAEDFLDVVAPEDRRKLMQHYNGLLRSDDIPDP